MKFRNVKRLKKMLYLNCIFLNIGTLLTLRTGISLFFAISFFSTFFEAPLRKGFLDTLQKSFKILKVQKRASSKHREYVESNIFEPIRCKSQ